MPLLIKTRSVINVAQNIYNNSVGSSMFKYLGPSLYLTQSRSYAARKGTRERRKKQKVKIEEEKIKFVPHNQRDELKFLATRVSRKFDDSWKKLPTDDVYPHKYYQWKLYDFAEAVECHRETHHPEMYNQPSAPLHLIVELNMTGEKKNKYLENFHSIAGIPHKFEHGEERKIVAFTKDIEVLDEIRKAGAEFAGSTELIKEFQNGNLSVHDFQFVLAHPNILPELVVLRGLMKRRFPNVRNGTLEVNLVEAVDKFRTGLQYSAVKDEFEKDFASVDVVIGMLDMDTKHLEENAEAVLNNIYSFRLKKQEAFITRCLLISPPSREKFKINYQRYLKTSEVKKGDEVIEETQAKRQAAAV
ncbi:54s ribosomal protein l1 mitochondrial [Holotrichia oblita]|uniref:54s ribosomal protein l1 mitochondrial n=1 Tax=Holotrichia oblita TaxID=644536 RepID=A0ACB9SSM1_HOLOL|nr:54s ribosomal protein l1 mitochondrial [Holotrichia oblita]